MVHIEQLWKMAGQMSIGSEENQNIIEIIHKAKSIHEIGLLCFSYGKMAGKQEERQRWKKSFFLQEIHERIAGNKRLESAVYAYVKTLPKKNTAPGGNPEAVKNDGRPSKVNKSLPSSAGKSKEGQR